MNKQKIVTVAAILSILVGGGCYLFSAFAEKARSEKAANQQYQLESTQRDALEKEAHTTYHDWYLVKIGKYDGECRQIDRSARADVDLYSYAILERAKKDGDDYLLEYSIGGDRKMYTTSPIWCLNVINANIER